MLDTQKSICDFLSENFIIHVLSLLKQTITQIHTLFDTIKQQSPKGDVRTLGPVQDSPLGCRKKIFFVNKHFLKESVFVFCFFYFIHHPSLIPICVNVA